MQPTTVTTTMSFLAEVYSGLWLQPSIQNLGFLSAQTDSAPTGK